MRIHDLEFLSVRHVIVDGPTSECGAATVDNVSAVSLYGHWCHVKYVDGTIESIPAHRVHSILWS